MNISAARPEGYVKNPQHRMDAMAAFLKTCGNPQSGIPAIHVTGTSGKGSVCAAIAGILKTAGLKVGLHVSPYMQSATEKIWIDGRYVSATQFADLVDWIMPKAKPLRVPETPASIHGMASVAIAFEAFRRAHVDVMIFEAGCGGRYDLTSFMDTSVAVITNVGLDHVVSLGPTIKDIAWHKAGIARQHTPLITGAGGDALTVIQQEAHLLNSPLQIVSFRGTATAHNDALAAAAAATFMNRRHTPLSDDIIQTGIRSVRLPGRFEQVRDDRATVFIDGAHNADKLTAAVSHVVTKFPNERRVAVVGLLGTKAEPKTIAPIIGHFDTIIATQPNVYGKQAFPAAETAALFCRECEEQPLVYPNPEDAVNAAVDAAQGGVVLICGSFYLCGELRNRWFAKQDVVLQQNSWPDTPTN